MACSDDDAWTDDTTMTTRSAGTAGTNDEVLADGRRSGAALSMRRCTHSTRDLAPMPIAMQLALATRTDVLVGTHSAALTYLLYLPPHACIVEFATVTDFHYDNL